MKKQVKIRDSISGIYAASWLKISVADPGCLSRIRIFSIPDSGSASKNLSILTQKIVSKLSEI
jgi:hypothetical protein